MNIACLKIALSAAATLSSVQLIAAELPSTCVPTPRPESHAHQWGLFREDLNEIKAHGANGYDVVLFGDSITDNWSWMARGAMESLGSGYGKVFNMGIGGDRTENLLYRLEHGALDGYKTKYFNLLIGTNNSFQKNPCDPPKDIAAAIRLILDKIIAKHPESKIILMPILPYQKLNDMNGAARRANNEAVNQLIVKFVDNKKVFWVDVREQLVSPDGFCKTEMFSEKTLDGIGHCLHPCPKAYNDVIVPALKAMIAKLDAGELPAEKPVCKPIPAHPGSINLKARADAINNQVAAKPVVKKPSSKSAPVNSSVRWTAVPMSDDGKAIRTDGKLVYAYARGNYTVNTVPFQGLGEVNLQDVYGNVNFRLDVDMYRQSAEGTNDYDNLLKNFWVGSDGERFLQLGGLEKGGRYLVQLVLCGKSDRISAKTPDGACAKGSGTGWDKGGSLVGIFVAGDDTEAFKLTTAGWTTFNALQVRKLDK